MGIYLEGMVNTPVDLTNENLTSCYTCNNDCPGVILDVLREDKPSWEQACQASSDIADVFYARNYHNVNFNEGTFRCRLPHLQMYVSEAKTLRKHLEPQGYSVELIENRDNKFRCSVVILYRHRHVHPLDMIPVFRNLPVRGE